MILPLAILKGWKLCTVLFVLSAVILAAAEESSNRTLIIISAITSGTSLMGVLISGLISLHNSRQLRLVAELPKKVEEFRKEVDGRMNDLRESRLETSVAKQEVARGEGMQQERLEERGRQEATAPTASEVEIVQPPGKSVPVKPDRD